MTTIRYAAVSESDLTLTLSSVFFALGALHFVAATVAFWTRGVLRLSETSCAIAYAVAFALFALSFLLMGWL